MGELLTRSELAESLGVHPESIARWVADDMPIAERGSDGRGYGHRYRDADARAWLIEVSPLRILQQPRTLGFLGHLGGGKGARR